MRSNFAPWAMLLLLFLAPSAQGELLLETQGVYFDAREGAWMNIHSIARIPIEGPANYGAHIEVRDSESAFSLDNSVHFVYEVFQKESQKRPAFVPKTPAALEDEDRELNKHRRQIGFRMFDSLTNETVAYWILYDGNQREGLPCLPCQGGKGLPLKYGDGSTPLFELRRLAKKGTAGFTFQTIGKIIMFHLRQSGHEKFAIYARTDITGARGFRPEGFTVEYKPEELGVPKEFMVHATSSGFAVRFEPSHFTEHPEAKSFVRDCASVFGRN